MTASYALRRHQESRALVSLCVGVGQGVALPVEQGLSCYEKRRTGFPLTNFNYQLIEKQFDGLNIRCSVKDSLSRRY